MVFSISRQPGDFCVALKPVQQYAARLHAEKLKRCLYQSQKAAGGTLGTKAFNMRLCNEDVSDRLTGFQHNAVTPIGSASPDMPIVLSHRHALPQCAPFPLPCLYA